METTSTTPGDNPSDSTATTTTDPAQTGTDNNGTAPQGGDNPDPSKSTDTTPAADGDKKPADTTSSGNGDTPASKLDDDLDDWIDKRGLPKPTDDAQKQKYQDLRNEQREFTRTQQAKKDADNAASLNKEIEDAKKAAKPDSTDDDEDEDDETEKRLKAIEADRDHERNTRLQSEFYVANKVSDAEHQAMLTIIKEKVAGKATPEEKLKAIDYWGSPEALPDLLDIAKARVNKGSADAAAEAAAQEERERIANESHSSGPTRSATKSSSGSQTPEEERHAAQLARYKK